MVLNGSVFTAVQRLLASEDEKIVDSTAFFLACAVADNGWVLPFLFLLILIGDEKGKKMFFLSYIQFYNI